LEEFMLLRREENTTVNAELRHALFRCPTLDPRPVLALPILFLGIRAARRARRRRLARGTTSTDRRRARRACRLRGFGCFGALFSLDWRLIGVGRRRDRQGRDEEGDEREAKRERGCTHDS